MNDSGEVIFVINPGSTSTKLAVFAGDRQIRHAVLAEEGSREPIWNQLQGRLRKVREWFSVTNDPPSAVVGIGGLLRPLVGGTYVVNERMKDDARRNLQGEHASNLGCVLAAEVAGGYGCPAYTVDPVSVDEFEPLARISGHPSIERRSLAHALNIHAAARKAAAALSVPVASSSFVVAHLGGGISISPVKHGRMIDVNDASSDGPFSPERTGGLPLQQFITLCFSGRFSEAQAREFVMGRGGMNAYLGTSSAQEVGERIDKGDAQAGEILEAMAYQIAKEIAAMASVLHGGVNAVVLTGGLAFSSRLVSWISERITFIGPILTFPGELEMEALALGALRVLRGEEQPKEY